MRVRTNVDVDILATGNLMRLMGLYEIIYCTVDNTNDLSTQNSFNI